VKIWEKSWDNHVKIWETMKNMTIMGKILEHMEKCTIMGKYWIIMGKHMSKGTLMGSNGENMGNLRTTHGERNVGGTPLSLAGWFIH